MTQLEYKCIELIIDKYTRKKFGGYYGSDYKEIGESDIKKIKDEIKDLITEDKQ